MSYKVVQKVKGNYYLYEVTATWDSKTKNSRQKRKYLGKCDESGNLIGECSESTPVVRELGRSYLMYCIARSLRLPEKLNEVFGDDGDLLLISGIQRSLRVALPRHNIRSMSRSFLPQLLCTDPVIELGDTKGVIRCLNRNYGKRKELFGQLVNGNDVMVFKLTSLSESFESLYLNSNDEYGFTNLPPLDIYLAVSDFPDGPFYFTMKNNNSDREQVLLDIDEEIRGLGPHKITFFLSKADVEESVVTMLVRSGILFSEVVPISTPLGKSLIKQYGGNLFSDGRMTLFNKSLIRVLDIEHRMGDYRCRLLIITDERLRNMQMISTYKSLEEFEFKASRMKWSLDLRSKLGDSMFYDCYNYSEGENGYIVMERIQDKVDELVNQLGVRMILTNSDDSWDTILVRHNRHDRFKNEVDVFKTELENGSMIMDTVEEATSTFLNEFLSLVLRTKLSTLIKNANMSDLGNYVDILDLVGGIYAVNSGDGWAVSDISSEQRSIFDRLDIPAPSSEILMRLSREYIDKYSA